MTGHDLTMARNAEDKVTRAICSCGWEILTEPAAPEAAVVAFHAVHLPGGGDLDIIAQALDRLATFRADAADDARDALDRIGKALR